MSAVLFPERDWSFPPSALILLAAWETKKKKSWRFNVSNEKGERCESCESCDAPPVSGTFEVGNQISFAEIGRDVTLFGGDVFFCKCQFMYLVINKVNNKDQKWICTDCSVIFN